PQRFRISTQPGFARTIAWAVRKPSIGGDRRYDGDAAVPGQAKFRKERLDCVDSTEQIHAHLTRGRVDAFGGEVWVGSGRCAGIRDQEIDRVLTIELAKECCHCGGVRHVDCRDAHCRPLYLAGTSCRAKALAIASKQAESDLR